MIRRRAAIAGFLTPINAVAPPGFILERMNMTLGNIRVSAVVEGGESE
jgi:hypothetical protein